MLRSALFRPKSSVFLSGDLALKYLPSNQSNPRTLGLGLLFLGWVMTCVVVVAVEWLCSLSKQSLGDGQAVVMTVLFSCRPRAYCLADSDEESSSAGSSEEDDAPEPSVGDKPLLPGAEG